MVLKLTTYFIVVPSLTHMAQAFNVSENTILQTGTVYEAGKFVGCIMFGVLGDQFNLLHVIGRSMEIYIAIAVPMLCWLYLAPASLPDFGIYIFFPFYFVMSVAAVASQFGLVILKLITTKQGARRWILIQAILSGSLQGTYMLVGSLFVDAFGWTSTFVFMTVFAVVSRLFLLSTTRKEHYEPCSVEAREKKRLKSASTVAAMEEAREKAMAARQARKVAGDGEGEEEEEVIVAPPSTKCAYLKRIVELYCSGKHVEYVLYVAVLGAVTATMYVFPATALLVLVDYGGLGNWTEADDGKDSQVHGTTIIFIVFLFNFGARVAGLFLIKRFNSAQFVFVGILSIGFGTLLLLVLSLASPPSIFQIVAPGIFLMAGVGTAQPMCKAGALLSISDRLANTATSMMKIVQLLFAVIISYIAGAVFDGTMFPLAATFAAMNLPCLALWIALHKGSRDDCARLCCGRCRTRHVVHDDNDGGEHSAATTHLVAVSTTTTTSSEMVGMDDVHSSDVGDGSLQVGLLGDSNGESGQEDDGLDDDAVAML